MDDARLRAVQRERRVTDPLRNGRARGVVGVVVGVSPGAVLQVLQLERRTCLVWVSAPDREGELVLDAGQLVAATAGELAGEDAVYAILAWSGVRLEIGGPAASVARNVSTPLQQLLLDAVRRVDESARAEAGRPPAASSAANDALTVDAIDAARVLPAPADHPDRADDAERPPPTPEAVLPLWSLAVLEALQASLDALMAIDGVRAASILDLTTGATLAHAGGVAGADPARRGTGLTIAYREALRVEGSLGDSSALKELLFRTADGIELLRPLLADRDIAWSLALDRDRADLELIRRRLAELDTRFGS
jgi:hypothetical protein